MVSDEWGNQLYAPVPCPFHCPVCRGRLDWDGGCVRCHGTKTGERAEWCFPGDRYERDESHWVKVASGPRMACSYEENQTAMANIKRILAGGPMAVTTPVRMLDTKPASLEDANAGW